MPDKKRAPKNRTVMLSEEEKNLFQKRLLIPENKTRLDDVIDKTICMDILRAAPLLPDAFADLMILDPPYNLNKKFHDLTFARMSSDDYASYLDKHLQALYPLLKPTASVYICADWRSSSAVLYVAGKYFKIRNRITWEREKGRGAARNWKNCAEDIWFCTVSEDYIFNLDAVKLNRRVIAPYTKDGEPKDWRRTESGGFRLTHPSNVWTDLTVPFWSMPENTDHPAQKPEKLMAKIILAGSNPGDVVFDPFLGSGTASVAAKKLGRKYVGVEIDPAYCLLAEKRLHMAKADPSIQGYIDGVFYERNTIPKR